MTASEELFNFRTLKAEETFNEPTKQNEVEEANGDVTFTMLLSLAAAIEYQPLRAR
jgi:hypothetical protein